MNFRHLQLIVYTDIVNHSLFLNWNESYHHLQKGKPVHVHFSLLCQPPSDSDSDFTGHQIGKKVNIYVGYSEVCVHGNNGKTCECEIFIAFREVGSGSHGHLGSFIYKHSWTLMHSYGHLYITFMAIWMFLKIGVPQNGWFIMERPIKMDDLGVPLFSETSIWIDPLARCFYGHSPGIFFTCRFEA